MLRWRLISATIILSLLFGLIYLDVTYPIRGVAGVWLLPILLLAIVGGVAELLNMLATGGHRPARWSTHAGSLLVFLATCAPLGWPLTGNTYPIDCSLGKLGWPLAATACAILLAFLAEVLRYHEPGKALVNVALAVFAICYVGLLASFLVLLRTVNSTEPLWGMVALLSTISIVKMSDTGAYTFGRLFGKHKLAPRLSPGKTIEGLIGGLVTAVVTALIWPLVLIPMMLPQAAAPSLIGWFLCGLMIAIAGVVGDLAESLLKRDMRCKDSGRWIPGLGGFLDILDSLLFAAPVAFCCWTVGLVGSA